MMHAVKVNGTLDGDERIRIWIIAVKNGWNLARMVKGSERKFHL
jgi:hypothetical protein